MSNAPLRGPAPLAAHPVRRAASDAVAGLLEAQRLLAAGEHAGVDTLLRPALDRAATRPEANYLLAIAAMLAKSPLIAIDHARQAVRGGPTDPRYHFTLGRALKSGGELDAAEAAYRKALSLDPAYVDAMVSLGIVLKTRGDPDQAISWYDRAIALAPKFAPAHANRSNALALRIALAAEQSSDDEPTAEVIDAQSHAVTLDPQNAVLQRNHGVLLMRARRRRAAAEAFNRALSADPADVQACLNLGFCLRALGDGKLAQEVYQKWLALNPPHAVVMRSLSMLLTRDGKIDEARQWAEKAAALDLDAHALNQLGSTLMQSRRHEESMAHCRRAIDMSGGRIDLYPTLLIGANYLYEEPETIFEVHAEFGRRLSKPASPRPAWRPLAAGERLRIGYLSGDFVRHSVSYFISGLLEKHDKSRFEVTCYNSLGWGDATTERLKSYGHRWVDCEGLSDQALRRRIQDDGIHVLIDLAGHTSHSRALMLALEVAPLQLSYLGYPTVTGVHAIDHRITDTEIDPGDMPPLPGEQPLPLQRSMFCYRPDEHPPVATPPVLDVGYITFGSFNNIAKVTDHTLELWAAVMNGVPGSRLMLKSAAMAEASNRENIERFMAKRDIAAERMTLEPWIAGKSTHLEMYNRVDVALDPFPYNGATTTCEALWMGVPVVTLRGRTHTSRMGASILKSVGRGDWVTESDAAYVATALALASDTQGLARWRAEARQHLAQSALFDEAGFTRDFEAALLQAWGLAGERAVRTLRS